MSTEQANPLPPRSGEPPVTRQEMPHQQLDQTAPATIQEELWSRMSALQEVRSGRSGVSLPESRAVHLNAEAAGGPADAFMVGTEFAHLHGASDGSLHMMLPPELATEAMEKGWAEPHPLARRGMAPANLVMVFGPRDEAELDVVWRLVQASHRYARGEHGATSPGD